jgi:hypothetical protein
MSTEPVVSKNKNRETMLLVAVALFGLAGLAYLQFSKKTPARTSQDTTLVQTKGEEGAVDAQTAAPVQKIPGQLLRTSEYPEAGKPFTFYMTQHSPGAVYELDLGAGVRKAFVDGKVGHTFKGSGGCFVRLYAKYEGQEILLDTLSTRVVAQKVVRKPVSSFIDY